MTFSKAIAVCNECGYIGLNEIHFCKDKHFSKAHAKKNRIFFTFCLKCDESKQNLQFCLQIPAFQNQVPLSIQIPSTKGYLVLGRRFLL